MARSEALPATDTARAAAPARAERTERISVEQHSAVGLIWFGGWLFSIGFLHLPFWKALLALIIWPYYLGTMLNGTL